MNGAVASVFRARIVGIATLCALACSRLEAEQPYLSERNTEAPYCYLVDGERRWPFIERELPQGARISFAATRDGQTLAEGQDLNFSGLTVAFSDDQKLEIVSPSGAPRLSFTLDVTLTLPDGKLESQQLSVRPAPPNRPISYYSDFGDDLISIFMDSRDGHWKPITKSAFDQYFRRCQAHGVTRLIMWMRPFPFICDPANYPTDDWNRYEKQARAIVESEELQTLLQTLRDRSLKNQASPYVPWGFTRQLCEVRLMRDFGPMLAQSAAEHGIALTASFHPLETALTKYWEIPAFDHDGKYLWGFLPEATPQVNYRPNETCFAHYRTILAEMGREDAGLIGAIEFPEAANAASFAARFENAQDNLRIVATNYAPVQENSLVLQRQADGEFWLRRFGDFKQLADLRQHVVDGYRVEVANGRLQITGLNVPAQYRYLILSNPSDAAEAINASTTQPVQLWAKAGNRLGRTNVYWALDRSLDPDERTKVAGIAAHGIGHTEFHATEASRALLNKAPKSLPLLGHQLVIDLGAPWSVEMMDLNRPAKRAQAVKELASILALPAFDELFINTRSHTQLASNAERAYAPLAAANDAILRDLAANSARVEQITVGPPNEWTGLCQSEACASRWRYVRNREIASGTRQLLEDLARVFPDVRTRVVVPLSEKTELAVRDRLDSMISPTGKPYGRDYPGIWSTINTIRSHGEGLALMDLSGLSAEPVFFGIRNLPDAAPMRMFLRHSFAELSSNRGSSFRGPRSFFYEPQETLRGDLATVREAARRREAIIRELLSHTDEINEVILYESMDWLYKMPLADAELCGYEFLDCPQTTVSSEVEQNASGQ